jgi:hypothetical protein
VKNCGKPAAFSFSGCKGKGAGVICQFGKENKIKNKGWPYLLSNLISCLPKRC